MEFLESRRWPGHRTDSGAAVLREPHAHHFEYSQIGQFLDARLRYRFGTPLSLSELMAAWRRDGGLEQLLAVSGAQLYIEVRAPGAGFADTCLLRVAGAAVAQSVLLSPSALRSEARSVGKECVSTRSTRWWRVL